MKFIDLSTLPVTWTKIGTLPIIGNINIGRGAYTCIVNGYFSIFYPVCQGGNPQNSKGAILFSFDGLGNMCTYHTSDFSFTGNQDNMCLSNQIWQDGNTLIYALLNGGTWEFDVPPLFTPGVTYVIQPKVFDTTPPCTQETEVYIQSIFCSQQGYYCNEFGVQGSNVDYWATIRNRRGGFNGGYIGHSPSSVDIFDQRNIILPPNVFVSNIYDRNGVVVYGDFSSGGSNPVIGTFVNWLNGDPTKLICLQGDPSVYVSALNPQQLFVVRDYGMPGFASGPDFTIMGSTDMLGYILFPDNVLKMISPYYYIQLPTLSGASFAAYQHSKKQLYNVIGFPQPYQTNDVYVASLNLDIYEIPATVTNQSHNTLTNYARPISVTGSYLT